MGSALVARVGRKGVVVLPKAFREALNLKEGDLVCMELVGDAIVLRKLAPKRVRLGGRVSQVVREVKREELELES